MHGSAEDTRIFHHEHRSKKGRKNLSDIQTTRRLRIAKEERQEGFEKNYANEIMRRFNSDPRYRKIYKKIK